MFHVGEIHEIEVVEGKNNNNYNGGINLKKNIRKICLIKIAILVLIFFALTGCRGRDNYYRDYGDPYYSLVSQLDRLSINNLDDIEDMVYIAWEYGAFVEVDFLDHNDRLLETEFIDNDQMLDSFLDGIYYEEFFLLDAVVEEDGYDLFLIFIVEI